jgi:hypothetical protein
MTEAFEIIPHVGVGPVRFGMTRRQVQTALAVPAEPFSRSSGSAPADLFKSIWAVAYYSDEDQLEAIEFALPQQINIAGLNLTTATIADSIREVLALDPEAELEPSGFTSKALGAGIWTEGEMHDPPQSVIVFARGYYD